MGLPWRVTGVMLAGPLSYYEDQAASLTQAFAAQHGFDINHRDLPLAWVARMQPRKFGRVLDGDIAACQKVKYCLARPCSQSTRQCLLDDSNNAQCVVLVMLSDQAFAWAVRSALKTHWNSQGHH